MRSKLTYGVALVVIGLIGLQFYLHTSRKEGQALRPEEAKRLTPEIIPARTLNSTSSAPVVPSATLAAVFTDSSGIGRVQQVERALSSQGGRGVASVAVVQIGDKLHSIRPDPYGQYERIQLSENQTIPIAVSFPELDTGDKVAVSAEDGGRINKKQKVQVYTVDDQHRIAFAFTTDANDGIYRITLRSHTGLQELNFWVGPHWIHRTSTEKIKK
jgi:hypothetical protein